MKRAKFLEYHDVGLVPAEGVLRPEYPLAYNATGRIYTVSQISGIVKCQVHLDDANLRRLRVCVPGIA